MSNYNVRMHTMLGTSHSWAITMRGFASGFLNGGHNLYLKTTNGTDDIPLLMQKHMVEDFGAADIDFCYTLPKNFRRRFLKGSGMRAAIYNYETDIVPFKWKEIRNDIDFILPSSNFCRDIFIKNGWPEEKCVVIPLGINLNDFKDNRVCKLNTKKSFKFLNISIPHYRKNIFSLLKAYYSAFSNDDDVCLVLKTSLSSPKHKFECDVRSEIVKAQKKFRGKKLPQVEVVTKNFLSMVPLYNSCDVLVSASSAEGFGLPFLEAMAAKKIVIAPRCTGQLDFLDDENSLLVDVSKIRADSRHQYWRPSKGAETYDVSIDNLSERMLESYNNYSIIKNKFYKKMEDTASLFSWESSSKKVVSLYESI